MSKKILIVDDSRVQLMTMTKLLSEIFSQHEIKSYSTPQDAFDDINEKKHEFHFALIDYNMPGMTGIELVEKLLSLPFTALKANNVSLLSANIQEAVQQKAFSLDIDFIAKPFDKEKLKGFLEKKGISNG